MPRRKIELDALALALGVGLVFGFAYWLLQRTDLVEKANLMRVLMPMVATHAVAVVAGQRCYA